MLKRYHRIAGGVFRIADAGVIACVWLAAYWLRFDVPLIAVTKGFPAFGKYAALCPLVVILWLTVFSAMRVYQSRRMLGRTDEIQLILKAHGIALLLFIAITYLFTEYKYSRGVVLYFGVIGGIALSVFRLFLRNSLRTLRKQGFNLRHGIAVGGGPALESFIQSLDQFPEIGLRMIGVLTHPSSHQTQIAGKPVIGHFHQIKEIIQQFHPDQILLALPRNQYGELDQLLNDLKDEVMDIQLIPDIHEYITLGCAIEDFNGLPIVNINDSPLGGWGAILKRCTDIIAAGLGLILLSPLFLLLAIAIRISSPGRIFYSQTRMGLDGQTFQMLKFRSMAENAESHTGAVWAQPNDSRRTRLGSFLRSTSLDELPQLWNVLKGHMSLVGPRPERPVFVQKFRHEIPHYMLRHKVKAGITGWAQVHGWRGNTSLSKRIEFDLYYIRHWSYLLDIKIIFLTLLKGFINKNAY